MTEIVKDPNEGTVIPGEEGAVSQAPSIRDSQEEAQKDLARKTGWRPLKEWDGDPGEWVTAKEYLARQSFFDKIKAQNATIRSLQGDIQVMAKHFSEMRDVEYQRALSDLKQQRKDAITNADVDQAEKISDQISAIEQKKQEVTKAPQRTGDPQEFEDWKSKNVWYGADNELTQEANALGLGYAQANPGASPKAALNYVESRIRKMYPEKFGKKTITPPSPEGGGITQASAQSRSKNKISEGDLNDMQRKIMNTLVQRGIQTKEQYLDSLTKAEQVKNASSLDK